VVAVDDEVGVAQLVDDDRREGAVRESLLHRAHALAHVASAGRVIAIEVGAAAVCADDVAQRDRPDSEGAAADRAQPRRRFVERQQIACHQGNQVDRRIEWSSP
jgi:hypothetical protein